MANHCQLSCVSDQSINKLQGVALFLDVTLPSELPGMRKKGTGSYFKRKLCKAKDMTCSLNKFDRDGKSEGPGDQSAIQAHLLAVSPERHG